jgi:5-methylcytosine-specific restriction endonuclease McrA
MIHVDMTRLTLDTDTKTSLDAATKKLESNEYKELAKKYKYIDSQDKLWRKTLNALAQLTNSTEDNCKCWYCESDGASGFSFHVDHFRPKKCVKTKGSKKDEYEPGYWWLAFNPENYRIACQKCNSGSGKNDQFPLATTSSRAIFKGGEKVEKVLLLDPTETNDPDLLVFSQDGDVHASSSCQDDDDRKRVEISINVYDLRHRSKRVGRRMVWVECREYIHAARQIRNRLAESLLLSRQEKEHLKKEYGDAIAKIKRKISQNAKFSMTAKSCIREYYKIEKAKAQQSDLEWLINLL